MGGPRSQTTQIIPASWPIKNGVRAFTTTRCGGVSKPPFNGFNLGDHVKDDAKRVVHNRRQLSIDYSLPSKPLWLTQVHGTAVYESPRVGSCAADPAVQRHPARQPNQHPTQYPSAQPNACGTEKKSKHTPVLGSNKDHVPTADASVTRHRNDVLAVLTADCLPIVLHHAADGVLAVVHGGWRGLAHGILATTLQKMDCEASGVSAWLGPAIGPECFEVGDDVWDQFVSQDWQLARCFTAQKAPKFLADIYAIARRQLHTLGVDCVSGGEYCTVSNAEQFFSFRRDGQTGRMATLAWMTPEGLSR